MDNNSLAKVCSMCKEFRRNKGYYLHLYEKLSLMQIKVSLNTKT